MSTTFESGAQKQPPLFPTAVKYGVIAGLAGVVVSIIFFLLDMSTSQMAGVLGWLILLVAIILGMREYRDDLAGGRMTFGQGVSLGLLMSLITGVLGIIWFMVFVNVLEPDFMEQLLLKTEEQLIADGQSDEVIEQAMEVTKKFMTPLFMSITSLISYLLIGLVMSLIVAAFTKRD